MRRYTASPQPDDQVRVDGQPASPVYSKTTSINYFGRPWLYERDLWVSAVDWVSLLVDGEPMEIRLGGPAHHSTRRDPTRCGDVSRIVMPPSPGVTTRGSRGCPASETTRGGCRTPAPPRHPHHRPGAASAGGGPGPVEVGKSPVFGFRRSRCPSWPAGDAFGRGMLRPARPGDLLGGAPSRVAHVPMPAAVPTGSRCHGTLTIGAPPLQPSLGACRSRQHGTGQRRGVLSISACGPATSERVVCYQPDIHRLGPPTARRVSTRGIRLGRARDAHEEC